jgi:hypothetical protein
MNTAILRFLAVALFLMPIICDAGEWKAKIIRLGYAPLNKKIFIKFDNNKPSQKCNDLYVIDDNNFGASLILHAYLKQKTVVVTGSGCKDGYGVIDTLEIIEK